MKYSEFRRQLSFATSEHALRESMRFYKGDMQRTASVMDSLKRMGCDVDTPGPTPDDIMQSGIDYLIDQIASAVVQRPTEVQLSQSVDAVSQCYGPPDLSGEPNTDSPPGESAGQVPAEMKIEPDR